MTVFDHIPHPHINARAEAGPVRAADHIPAGGSAWARMNTRLAVHITDMVGSMNCAWAFLGISLVSLPAAIRSGDVITIVGWVAQTCLQLVLLSVIMVGQNVQTAAGDARAQATYSDAEAVLHESLQIQQHLAAQDARLLAQDEELARQTQTLVDLLAHATAPAPPQAAP